MRSGTNWVGTDWFPSGSAQYSYSGQSQVFYFSASRVSNTRKVRINWWMTTESNDNAGSPTYFLCYGTQKLVVNGQTIFTYIPSSGNNPYYINSSGNTVYYGFADSGSWLDKNYNGHEYFDRNGDYVGINRYIVVLGTKWRTGAFDLEANSLGNVSFSVSGTFGWWGNNSLTFSKTFTVTGLVPTDTYTISFNANTKDLVSGNTAFDIPKSITKQYNVDVNLPTVKPYAGTRGRVVNYDFYKWITNPANSFEYGTNSVGWTAGELFRENANTQLYAIWKKAKRTLTFDLNGGKYRAVSDRVPNITAYYSDSVSLPTAKEITKDGYIFTGWRDSAGTFIPNLKNYTVNQNTTLTAQYEGRKYEIILLDKDGNAFRSVIVQYGSVIQGKGCDFTYTPAGYECVGWSVNSMQPIDVDADAPRIAKNYETPLNNLLYIGAGDYTNSPFMIDAETARIHSIIGNVNISTVDQSGSQVIAYRKPTDNIDGVLYLYPILRYATSFYVYTNGGWKLAMPYVCDNNGLWKQSSGYINQGDRWIR